MPIRKAEAKSAADAASSGDVIEELRRRYDRLTQSQKRIAEYIVEHSQAVAFSTVDQMAAQAAAKEFGGSTCGACHKAYREGDAQAGFKFKAGVI